ncbi:MAG: Transcriptional regulatory protein [Sporanaerobacter sp.]|jgi:CRP/FNR family transcriptional regulator, dissimilatory nitrate respiration regulator|uniref:Crp/Fnr family transcriptional regulator n=1 Tax=Sporanaerobacter sp. TaxID=2010183 RepID=UPI003A0FF917
MKNIIPVLNKCVLFKNISKEEIEALLNEISYNINTYKKDEIIALEESKCTNLGMILEGKVEVQKIFPSGKVIALNNFSEGNIFGEALVFSEKNVYPSTIVSTDDTKIMFVQKNDIIKLCSRNDKFLNNFMTVLSDRILMLSGKIRNLSYETIRKKVANILLEEYKKQKTVFLTLPYSRKKMAEMLNVQRPSLSRELINMKEEGIIDFDRNVIKILDVNLLEKCMFN